MIHKGIGHRIGAGIAGAVMVYCFITGAGYLHRLENGARVAALINRSSQGGMDFETAKGAQAENEKAEELLNFVNWRQDSKELVSGVELGRQEETDLLTVYGRTDILFPGCQVLDIENVDGCLVSRKLSADLFGGTDTVGLKLNCRGKELEILDVIDSTESFLVCEMTGQDTILLDRAAIKCSSEDEVFKTAAMYKKRYDGWEVLDYGMLAGTARMLYLAVPCVLAIFLLITVKRYAVLPGDNRIEKIVWYVVFILIVLACGWFLAGQIAVPQDMIPNKWSDFEFWSEFWKRKEAAGHLLQETAKTTTDMVYVTGFRQAVLRGLFAILGEGSLLYMVCSKKRDL